jgi:hypothetical protein
VSRHAGDVACWLGTSDSKEAVGEYRYLLKSATAARTRSEVFSGPIVRSRDNTQPIGSKHTIPPAGVTDRGALTGLLNTDNPDTDQCQRDVEITSASRHARGALVSASIIVKSGVVRITMLRFTGRPHRHNEDEETV